MKNSILALVTFGAFLSTAAAQTSLSIYGIVDAGIQRTDTDAPGRLGGATWGLESGLNDGSRIGFKGTEALGGRLSANFTLEAGYGIDTGVIGQSTPTVNRIFGRQAWVGLDGAFGIVRLGRQYTPMHLALDSIDPFETGLAGNIENAFNPYGIRIDNAITYATPDFGGFSGQLIYALGEVPGSTSAGQQFGFSVGFVRDAIKAIFAYHDANTTPRAASPAATPPVAAILEGDSRTAMIGGSYDFKVARAHFAYAHNKTKALGDEIGKSRDWMLGVSAPVGVGRVLGSFIRHDQRSGTVGTITPTFTGATVTGTVSPTVPAGAPTVGINAAGAAVDFDQWALGYTHGLSKRTTLYTSYGRINSKAAGSIDSNIFNVGIHHRF
jgi:predicted porin